MHDSDLWMNIFFGNYGFLTKAFESNFDLLNFDKMSVKLAQFLMLTLVHDLGDKNGVTVQSLSFYMQGMEHLIAKL